CRAGKAKSRRVEERGGKYVLLLHARHLLPDSFQHRAQRIDGGSVGVAVVNRIDAEERALLREVVVQTRGPKVLADDLQRIAERLREAADDFGTVLYRP